LLMAAEADDVEGIEVLLRAGANPDARDDLGFTALMTAATMNHASAVRALVSGGADPNVRHGGGLTALMFAAGRGHAEAVRALLDSGADPDVWLADGRGIFDLAKDHPRILRELSASVQR